MMLCENAWIIEMCMGRYVCNANREYVSHVWYLYVGYEVWMDCVYDVVWYV